MSTTKTITMLVPITTTVRTTATSGALRLGHSTLYPGALHLHEADIHDSYVRSRPPPPPLFSEEVVVILCAYVIERKIELLKLWLVP